MKSVVGVIQNLQKFGPSHRGPPKNIYTLAIARHGGRPISLFVIPTLGMVDERCWVNFPTRVDNLKASTVCSIEFARRLQLSGNHVAVDRVQRVSVGDLVFSQEDKPKRHWSAWDILHETAILRSNVHKIIHRIIQHNVQLKRFKRRCAHLLSEANRISRFTRW